MLFDVFRKVRRKETGDSDDGRGRYRDVWLTFLILATGFVYLSLLSLECIVT